MQPVGCICRFASLSDISTPECRLATTPQRSHHQRWTTGNISLRWWHTSEESSLEASPDGGRIERLDLQTASRLRGCARKLATQATSQKVETSWGRTGWVGKLIQRRWEQNWGNESQVWQAHARLWSSYCWLLQTFGGLKTYRLYNVSQKICKVQKNVAVLIILVSTELQICTNSSVFEKDTMPSSMSIGPMPHRESNDIREAQDWCRQHIGCSQHNWALLALLKALLAHQPYDGKSQSTSRLVSAWYLIKSNGIDSAVGAKSQLLHQSWPPLKSKSEFSVVVQG